MTTVKKKIPEIGDVIRFVTDRYMKKIGNNPAFTPEMVDLASFLHLNKRCNGTCMFCEIDRDAEAFILLTSLGVTVKT